MNAAKKTGSAAGTQQEFGRAVAGMQQQQELSRAAAKTIGATAGTQEFGRVATGMQQQQIRTAGTQQKRQGPQQEFSRALGGSMGGASCKGNAWEGHSRNSTKTIEAAAGTLRKCSRN